MTTFSHELGHHRNRSVLNIKHAALGEAAEEVMNA
jgi:hypothetical protein